jgi:hypothetical protein
VVCALAVAVTPGAAAQDSQLNVLGPGTPARVESARARATGGAFAPFDALSPLTDAALGDLRRLTAGALLYGSFRHVELGGAEANTRATRFPSFTVGGPPFGGGSLVLGVGYGTYLDQTYRVALRDSAIIRGQYERFTDVLSSDGSVADIRVAAAWRFGSRVAVGAGVHLLSGAAKSSVSRQFDDSATYLTSVERDDVQNTGAGVSASAMVDVTSALRFALWFRSDSRLTVSVQDAVTARYDLPTTFGGGLRWTLSPVLRFAASASARTWEDAGGRNTVEWAAGVETGSARLPLRLGVRQATLPFAPAGAEASEWAAAGGFGRTFSQGRARVDFTLERLSRTAGDLQENVWTAFLGFTVQP